MEIEKNKLYKRGRDYPPYAEPFVKMAMVMYGHEILKWFTKDELKDYPNPKGYTDSLP